jgi:hypothetical protein
VSGLKARIDRLEILMGADDGTARSIIIFFGPDFIGNTVNSKHGHYSFEVPCDYDGSPTDHLSPEQRSIIRPNDSVVILPFAHNRRDAGLNPNVRPRADDTTNGR